ncbi:hypothetical protein GCM10011391_33860 [Pullulanibacillus camelliae]|uniref:Uncharacterized protein n=1 Tax=Pullulanibacillus camelliae TaxID=1707096 RepID=A0A8J2YLP7_9BACL|nr:hypothetical protein [Pullulanibacillus camelliae]GGE52255.1 hypothetical protein GCM10011391_33860 [Pullulanibacillus camelliae]
MAFGITKHDVERWKEQVSNGQIAFLTHYWFDPRFPQYKTVTKAGCSTLERLIDWGAQYGLEAEWIDYHEGYPHFDLLGDKQYQILLKENCLEQIQRFSLSK